MRWPGSVLRGPRRGVENVMGIFNALYNAVSGLQAQSFALQNISGNIANSQTTAFKRIDTSFTDLVQDNLPTQQQAGSVLANSSPTNNVQGGIQNSATSTFMAVNGSGYFIVEKPDTFTDNLPVFSGVNLYTRRGDFQLDKNGFLVNGAGYYLMGIPVDSATGNPVGSVPEVLQFSNGLFPAQATTQIQYQANLAATPRTPSSTAGVVGSDLLNPALFQANPVAGASQFATITGINANLQADKKALGTGSVTGLTNATTLASLGLATGDVVTVTTGSGTNNFTVLAGSKISDLLAGITGGAAAVTATLNPSGQLQIQSNNFLDTVAVSDNATPPGADIADLGFGAGNTTFPPTNLLTQGISSGQTFTVTVGANPVQTITFGTGAGEVSTLAGLQTALAGLTNVTGSVNASGNISLAAQNATDTITVGGTATLSKFGIVTTTAIPSNGTVIGADQTNFLNQSVSGGSITAFDGTGNPVNLVLRWAKVDSTELGPGHTNAWNLFYQVDPSATGTAPAWVNAGTTFTFDSTGKMSPAIGSLTLPNVTISGVTLGNLQVIFGPNGLTQFANTSGTVQVNQIQQNGSAAGQLSSISVDDQGRVVGSYTNGKTVPLAEVTLSSFNGENFLKQLDGGAYAATADSGPPLLNASGKVVGAALEASNT